ncbi:DUF4231 domain-containing protein [Streptomyces sp. NPDC057257]|uniref:DUF4231 domain-containing protein n=1 Tax=Streptomyces sp. NPDC057257 TaxID=3346071 RepID=UPI00363B9919
MSDERGTTGRLRALRARRWVRLVWVVLCFGAAALVSHFWLGESWSQVAWLAVSLSVVVGAVVEVRERRRTERQSD